MSADAARTGVLALVLALLFLWVPAPAQSDSRLHQDGTRIVDPQGKEVKLRGVNLGGWLVWEGWIFGKGPLTSETTILARLGKAVGASQVEEFRSAIYNNFITEADIRKIAETGFNCVRLPLHRDLFDGNRGWELLDRLLDQCERHHVYVVLDLHAAPGGQSKLGMADPGDGRHLVWDSPENQDRTVAIWKAIAARYRNRPVVAGYDLLNEPAPPSGQALVSLYRRLITTIRAEDPGHLIFLEGAKFATDFSMFDKPLGENQAFSFHMYTWFGDDRKQKLAAFQALAQRCRAPLWGGEFGENTYAMIGSTVEMYERCPEINGWAFWTWKKAANNSPGLVTIKTPESWDKVMDSVGSLLGLHMPDEAKVRTGMKEFIEAAKLKNCAYDERMKRALTPKK
jgi:hypothetical protein